MARSSLGFRSKCPLNTWRVKPRIGKRRKGGEALGGERARVGARLWLRVAYAQTVVARPCASKPRILACAISLNRWSQGSPGWWPSVANAQSVFSSAWAFEQTDQIRTDAPLNKCCSNKSKDKENGQHMTASNESGKQGD